MSEYNGWTNYATWRVSLEVFDDPSIFKGYDSGSLRDYLEHILDLDCENDLTLSYAMAFINQVNFYEIETAIKESNDELEDQ